MAALEENEYGPKEKYVRFLVIKAWQKKFKICKFYNSIRTRIKEKFNNTIVTLKSLIVIHNYLKKGPFEVMNYKER